MNATMWFSDGAQLWVLALAAKVCVVMALALVTTRLMRRRPAAERHFVWVVAVAAVLVLPLLTFALPAVDVPIAAAPVRVAAPPVSTPMPAPVVAPAPVEQVHAAVATPAPPAPVQPVTPVSPRRSGFAWLGLVWLLGALGVVSSIALGFVRVQRCARLARPLTDAALAVRARGIAAELGVSGQVRLLEGRAEQMPLTFGVLRPTLLLPATARQWTRQRQETVLRHELAHIRRRDSLTQLAAELACALHWFNPLVWLAARRLYVEREHACDDFVLVAGSCPEDYAAELLDIARSTRVQRGVPLAAIAMARPSQLRRRIVAVLEARQRRARLSGRVLLPSWLGAAVIILPLSSLTPALRGPGSSDRPARSEPHARSDQPMRSAQHKTGPALRDSWAVTPQVQRGATSTAPHVQRGTPAPRAAAEAPLATLPSLQLLRAGVLASRAPAAQQDCLSRGGNRSVNTNIDDRRSTIKWRGDGCSGEVRIDGDVTFDADFTTITGLSRDGSVRIEIDDGGDERRLTIRPQNGALTYEYSVNGRRADFDATAQRWLSGSLLFMFRNLGFMAQERATAILERRGADALLTEIGLLSGDHVRAVYMSVLVEKGRLDESSLRRVLELAGSTLRSDHYRSMVITAAAGRYEFTDGVRQAYIDAAARMQSDHYKHTAYAKVVESGNLTPAQLSAVLRDVSRISSDHYRSMLLTSAGNRYALNPEIRSAYLDAAASMRSDHYKSQVLDGLLRRELNGAELARVVDATQTVSDHYRAGLLSKVGRMGLREAALQNAFVRSASGIKSDHYKQAVLSAVVANQELDAAALNGVLDAAATISSDHYLSTLLVEIANKHRLQGETREKFLRAMDSIRSSHYKGNVASALLRQER